MFAYGTLCDPEVFQRVTGHLPGGPTRRAELAGYARYRFRDGSYLYIVPCVGASVAGLVLALRRADLALLDGYEDAQDDGGGVYHRVRVRVEVAGEGPRSAWTYVLGRRGEALR